MCPVCGSVNQTEEAPRPSATTMYGQYSEQNVGNTSAYVPEQERPYQEYLQPQAYIDYQQASQGYGPIPAPQQPRQEASTIYQAQVNVVVNKTDTTLVSEIILSLFGIFGVGWIMAGETALGIILLICSIFIYWPIMILGTIFTFGFGLLCLAPFAIGTIILNIVLLNSTLRRKARHAHIMPPPHIAQRR